MNRKHVTVVIPELHLRYYHTMSKLPWTTASRKLLKLCDRKIEAHIPLRAYFNPDWTIRQETVDKFAAEHNAGILQNIGAYHGMIGITAPHLPQNSVLLGNVADYAKNVQAIGAQIRLSRLLSDRTNAPRALLVFHLDNSSCPDDHANMKDTIANQFKENMKLAAEQNVQISIEIDIMTGYMNCFGYKYENVAAVVETVNAWCVEQGISARLGITMDLSHTLINLKGNFKEAHDVIDKYGDLINYAHINHPQRLPKIRPEPHSREYPTFLSKLRITLRVVKDADMHGKIYSVEGEQESHELIKFLLRRTKVLETGVINLELSPKPVYLHNYFRGGARAHETYESVKLLDRLIDEA